MLTHKACFRELGHRGERGMSENTDLSMTMIRVIKLENEANEKCLGYRI